MHKKFAFRLILREAAGEGAAGGDGGAADAAAAAAAAAAAGAGDGGAGAPAAKWWEGSTYSTEEQQWLAARGLTKDDPTEIVPQLVKGHRAAEQRLGRGLDSILDKPGKDQPISDWMRAHAADLGLPDKEDGYAVAPPEDWPKDAPWDTDLEAAARKLAFEEGIPPKALQGFVNLFAGKVKAMNDASEQGLASANDKMMSELRRDYGEQTGAVITKARQGAQIVAEKAGFSPEALASVGQVLSEKAGGDANTIRFMAAIADMMGEDRAAGLGNGGSLTMTSAEARAELARFQSPEGEYGKAFAAGDTTKMRELSARREQLSKIAAG